MHGILAVVGWEVEYTDEFVNWWTSLSEDEQVEISAKVELLEEHGPTLPRPHADVITSSRHANMRNCAGGWEEEICGYCMPSIPGARPCS
jgi:hypothetical protein